MAKEKEYFPENKKNKLITSISEAERQRNAVRAMYEGTEKWLKAPNGKQTNLTEEQWVAIRTPNFKRWFGNWDYDGNKKIAVTEIDAKDLPFDYKNDKELRGWLQENLSGKSVRIADDGMITKLSNAGLRASMKRRGEENRSIYTKLEEIIKKSAYFDFENSDGKIKHQFLKGQDIYYSAVKIGDEYYSVKIKLDVNKASLNSYYKDHKVSEIKIAPLVIQTEAQKRTSAQERAIDTLNISQLAGGVKPSFSQVIDENGEPLVVYHGTDKHFDTFNRSEAIFFSKSVDYAESMAEERDGDVVYKTFLNIRNPLPVLQLEEDFSDPVKEVPFIEKAKNDGYDGICFSNDTKNELTKDTFYAAFNPNQIKSATDNNGNFDINNESILFQVIGEHRDQSNEKRNVALEQTYTQGGKSMPGEQKDLYISEEQALRIQLAREIKQNMPNLTDGERAAAIAILEAGAASQKMSLTDYVQQTFPNGVFGDYEKAQNAAHQQGVEINGAVSVSGFGANARAVIYASKTADFSTWCHELSHIWQAQLTGTLKSDAEKAFQVQNGNWQESIYTFADGHTDTSAEAFAYGFEDFLKHKAGEMATKDKKAIFEKFADYMSRTYNGVKQNIEMSEEIAKVYEQFVQLDDNILAEAEKAVRMEKDYNLQLKNKDLYEIFKLDADCDKKIDEVINATDSGQNEKVEKELGKLSDGFVALAARNGEDLEGYSHSIDSYFIKHDRKRHGISKSEVEHERGQVAITDDDIRKIPSVLESPDYIVFGAKNRQHNSTIIYVKNMEDGSSLYVEEERTRSKHLAANTFYKLSAASDATSISRIPALYAQNDHGSIKIIDVKNEIVNIQNNPILFQSAYHGSGASFGRFNTAQYGFSGEGSMSFGWGTYLTSSEDIARDYAIRRTSFTNKIEELQQKYPDSYPHIIPIHNNMSVGMSFEDAKKAYIDYLKENHIKGIRQVIKNINEFTEDDFTVQKRNLYSVEIPDGKFLEWDKTVPGKIRTEISEKLNAHIVESDPGSYSGNAAKYLQNELVSLFESEMDGQHLYGTLADYLGSEKQASEFLKDSGYTGISYPAGTIYGNGNDATNYVIFNDDDITIKEHLQFQLVGERSIMRMAESEEKERILADLQAAKLMESKYAGMDAAAKAARIRFATGWEKSADGRWKYELDDSKNRIKSGTLFQKILSTQPQMLEQLSKSTALTLDDIMEAPELFNVFPFMKNVRVSFYSDPNAFRAVLTPEGIKINTQYLNEVDGEKGMKGVLAHEIQHVIQAVEYSSSNGLHGESIELLYNDMQNAIKAAGTNRYDYDLTSLQEGLDEYMHDFGEVEARNVARRISMSYNERRHNTLESTEDVSRNLQFQTRGPASEKRNVALETTLTPEELKSSLKSALNEVSRPLEIVPFTRENYNRLFPFSRVQTPIEEVKLGEHQFEKLDAKERQNILKAVHEALNRPDIIINEERKTVFGDIKSAHVYAKSFEIDGKNKAVQSVVVAIEDENVSISTHQRDVNNLVNKIKMPEQLIYASAEIGQVVERITGKQLVTVNPTRVNEHIEPPKINISQNEEKSINTQGEKTMPGEKQIIAEIGFADGEIRQYEDSVPFLKDLNEATRENAYDTTFRVYADSDELKQKASDMKLDNYDPIEAAERMHNGYEWNDVEHEAVQFTQGAEGRRLLKDAENGRLTMLDARDILDAVEKNGMTLRYDPLPNSYVVDGWTAADGEKLDNYVVSMSELKRLAGIEISENSQQNQIQEKKTARTPEEEQAYQEWLEMLDDNQQAEDRMERMQGVLPEEQKQLPEWQQRLNATIKQAAEMDGVKDSIKAALYDNAENFNAVSFSREGYELLFPDGVVQSPIEQIKFADNQFDVNDKDRFMLAAFQTLSNPDLIYSETENKDNLESKNYVKTFVFGDDEKSALDIVVKTIDGQKVMISAQKRSLDDLIEHIKHSDQLIFMREEIKQTIDRRSPEEKQLLKDVIPNLRIVPTNEAYDKEKAITIAKDFFVEKRANQNPAPKIQNENNVQTEKRNVTPEPVQKPEHDTATQARDSYVRKHPTDWQIYTKELTDKLNAVSEQIENYLKYGTLPENSRFILPNSPQFMQKIGSHDTQISLPVAVVKKAYATHGLTLTEIQDAVKKLYNPVLAFDSDKSKSENKADSRLLLTDSFTKENKPVALAINVNSNVKLIDSNISAEVQDIRSIHDRTLIAKNGTDLIKKWTQDGLCRYVDDKKISDWSSLARVYFPIELLQSPKNNILTKTEIVNSFGKENTPKENISQEIKKEVTADRLNTDSKEKSLANKKYTPKEYLKYRSELFLKHLDQGNLPFMKGEQVGDDIIIKVKAVRNASNGRALTGFQQLMAQDIISTMVENKEIPRMDYEIITYEQAKEAGTFIKKGSPHFTLPVYNEKTNTVFNQIYYFKSGCNEPGKVDLLKLKIQRESFIGRERTKLEKAMKERDVPLDEKNKIFSSIAENHQAIIQYLNSVGKRKEAQEYKNNIPREERAVFDRLEEKKEIELNEMLRKNAEYQHRIEEEEFKRQKENPNLFNARETSSYEDFLGKTMAAMSIGGIVVTSKSTIDTVRSTLTPVLKQSFDQYDYMKGFQIGEVANGKCKENLRETRNNSRENQEIKQTLDKALGFQQGGRNSPPDRSKEIDGYDR